MQENTDQNNFEYGRFLRSAFRKGSAIDAWQSSKYAADFYVENN